jgi:hypothetical protein
MELANAMLSLYVGIMWLFSGEARLPSPGPC